MADSSFNPYAAPQTLDPYAPVAGDFYRRGMLLIVPRHSAPYLPCDTCVKCGRPAARKLKRTLYWHNPGLYFLILLYLLIYLIVALIVRKQLKVTIGLCRRTRQSAAGGFWPAGCPFWHRSGCFLSPRRPAPEMD